MFLKYAVAQSQIVIFFFKNLNICSGYSSLTLWYSVSIFLNFFQNFWHYIPVLNLWTK